MRQGKVFYRDDLAGIITETDDGEYTFQYDPNERLISNQLSVVSDQLSANNVMPDLLRLLRWNADLFKSLSVYTV